MFFGIFFLQIKITNIKLNCPTLVDIDGMMYSRHGWLYTQCNMPHTQYNNAVCNMGVDVHEGLLYNGHTYTRSSHIKIAQSDHGQTCFVSHFVDPNPKWSLFVSVLH